MFIYSHQYCIRVISLQGLYISPSIISRYFISAVYTCIASMLEALCYLNPCYSKYNVLYQFCIILDVYCISPILCLSLYLLHIFDINVKYIYFESYCIFLDSDVMFQTKGYCRVAIIHLKL